MTHTSTEQDRADFEAWYIKSAKNAVPAFSAWSDIEVRDGCMRPDEESYKIDTARISWEAWQAARRAPAVPQVWKLVPVELLDRATESLGSFVSDHGWGQADMDTFDDMSALAAAQKPPEAAPVQMPEPVAVFFRFETEENGPTETCFYPSDRIGMGWTALYTEQQVRALLEAKASVSNGTLSDVCQRENLREGEPYDNPAFEALARALGVWGTAQSAVCAQFWIAAKEQST